MIKKILCLSVLVAMGACSAGSNRSYKAPSVSGDAGRMSSDTLCYRAAAGTKNQAILDEIAARRIDCEPILASDPLYQGQ